MPAYTPVYLLRVYAPASEDPTETAVLTPHASAPHAEPFQVATVTGIAGHKGYLETPRGRRGRLDPLSKKTDTGSLSFTILDKRLGSANASRWVTGFVGDAQGRVRLRGCKVRAFVSTDGGTTLRPYFTGRIRDVATDGRTKIRLEAWGMEEDLKRRLFVGIPNAAVSSYVATAGIFPNGLTNDFGPVKATPLCKATVGIDVVAGYGTIGGLRVDGRPYLDDPSNRYADVMTAAFHEVLYAELAGAVGRRDAQARIRIGSTHYHIVFLPFGYGAKKDGDGHWRLTILGFQTLQDREGKELTGDPHYGPLPAHGSTVYFDVVVPGADAVSKRTPLYVSDVHPVTFLRHILLGYFGAQAADGSPTWTLAHHAASFAALEADATFGTGRWIVDAPAPDARKWIEENVLKPFNLGWYLDGDGLVRVVDLRTPTSSAGLTAIVQDDLAAEAAPGWDYSRANAVRSIRVTSYLDERLTEEDVGRAEEAYPDLPPALIKSTPVTYTILDLTDAHLPGDDYEVDAPGLRAFTAGEDRAQVVQSQVNRLATDLRGPYAFGVATHGLKLRRKAHTLALELGQVVKLTVDEQPNPASNLRGGDRLARVVEIREDGPALDVVLVDLGAEVIAVAPALGTVSKVTGRGREAVQLTVTLNAAGEDAEVEWAATSTAVGTRPGATDGAWRNIGRVTATGTVVVAPVPPGSRIWIRGRSKPTDADTLKLPSPWVYPSNDYADTDPIPAPTGLTATDVTGGTAELSWTNTDANLEAEVVLNGARRTLLQPGLAHAFLDALTANTAYTAEVRYRVATTGAVGPAASVGFSTSSSPPIAPTPIGLAVVVGVRV